MQKRNKPVTLSARTNKVPLSGMAEAPFVTQGGLFSVQPRQKRDSAPSAGAAPGSAAPDPASVVAAPATVGASPAAAPDAAPAILHGAEGHRERVRERLLTAGPESIADHELLEMLLFLAVPRRDTKPIARALLTRFGSFANALAASLPDLLAIKGLGKAGAAALKTVHAASLRMVRAEVINRPILANWDRLMEYLFAVLGRERIEQFRVLFLDSRNRLIADEALGRGTVNETPVYPREVVKRALELQATALILVHNHPTGDPTPSPADIAMTTEVRLAAEALRLMLHDHIIVGNGKWTSLRKEGLL
jgi:DNA repair protein RadC